MINGKLILSIFLVFVILIVCLYRDNAEVLVSPDYMLVLAQEFGKNPPPRLSEELVINGKAVSVPRITALFTTYPIELFVWECKITIIVSKWLIAPAMPGFDFEPNYGTVGKGEIAFL